MGDYRPISLVGATYKVVAKVLVNRIKKVMNSIIGETQMAFIKNRQILDSFVIAKEVIHKWRKSEDGGLLVKLDFEKAYESVDHKFLKDMMEVQGLSTLLSKAVNMGFIMGERLVLIKSVLNSIPTYYMSVFRMPVGVARKIEKLQRCFLWGDGIEKRKLHVVDWITVCKSKKNGGLGIGRILDKNEGLLSKWLWRFRTDGSSLWKKVVCDKYGVDGNRLLWDWKTVSGPSFFVNAVANVIRVGSRSASVFFKDVQVVVGNEINIRLWQDVMVESHQLKVAFPRISSGTFSVMSFRRALEEFDGCDSWLDRLPWRGICPPKVEFFTWQLLRGRVPVGDVLRRFGMSVDMDCKLCNNGKESMNHVFLYCIWTWKLWTTCMNRWNVVFCSNGDNKGWWENWVGMVPATKYLRAWEVMFYAVVWTVWESRNQVIFNDKETNVWQAIDIVKFRVAWWFKHLSKGSKETLTYMLLNIKELCVDGKPIKKINKADWIPPANSNLKFNVDGSVSGNPGPAGIGGVLRNFDGKVLCMFSCYIGIQDPNSAELVAIHKACALCVFIPSVVNRNIEIASDSRMAVSWINGEGVGSLNHVNLIYDICSSLERFGGKVVYSPRVSNQFADRLAKLGSNMLGDFV
ncbi:hypothetical protein Ddye_015801 [Dipteronia dyeriana]|uniref:RNase H type-1 domain-containing protein n=1 Tax=Dipteronia dyeriana TaxID=168575 RepID=A0AAD9U600_9ROSI|nr:hypothetical protein Ddye_015801 [Dipteronia dyeriana]